jgi:hypothetical protein
MNAIRSFFILVTLVSLTGCDDGPPRYEVTGVVTFEGQPVPTGRLIFTPDNAAGNRGPQGVAVVERGVIETEYDRRVIGGPHWVQIMAFDGVAFEDGEGTVVQGRPLCSIVQAPVDLPLDDVELKIEITQGEQEATATIRPVSPE